MHTSTKHYNKLLRLIPFLKVLVIAQICPKTGQKCPITMRVQKSGAGGLFQTRFWISASHSPRSISTLRDVRIILAEKNKNGNPFCF
jgi:hypothetical protein